DERVSQPRPGRAQYHRPGRRAGAVLYPGARPDCGPAAHVGHHGRRLGVADRAERDRPIAARETVPAVVSGGKKRTTMKLWKVALASAVLLLGVALLYLVLSPTG